jgi:hypothetical protein
MGRRVRVGNCVGLAAASALIALGAATIDAGARPKPESRRLPARPSPTPILWTFVRGSKKTRCARGARFGFWLRRADPARLLQLLAQPTRKLHRGLDHRAPPRSSWMDVARMARWSAITGPAGPSSPSRSLHRGAASRRRSYSRGARTPRVGTLLRAVFRTPDTQAAPERGKPGEAKPLPSGDHCPSISHARLRPLVETGQGMWRTALAHLSATKP